MAVPNTPYRIAFVDHAVDIGGAEKSLTELAQRLDHREFLPVLLHSKNAKWLADGTGEEFVRLSVFGATELLDRKRDEVGRGLLRSVADMLASAGPVFSIWRGLIKAGADLVHTNSLKCHLLGGLAAKLGRRPLVWHVRDILTDEEGLGLLRRAALTLKPRIIAISSAVARQFADLPVRLTLIPNGIPLEQFTPGPKDAQLQARLGLSPEDEVLCVVGRLTPWKGHATLLEAVSLASRHRPRLKLLVVGEVAFWENSYERELKEKADDLGLAGRVIWTGLRDDVPQLLRLCDVFVLPSVGEPFGRVLVEAMAVGKPVIGTNSGGVPEVIVEGETGLMVSPEDPYALAEAVAELLSDPPRAQKMGAAGLERARQLFDSDRVAAEVQKVYRELLHR